MSEKITKWILLTPVIGAVYFYFALSSDEFLSKQTFDKDMLYWSLYQGVCIGALLTAIVFII